MCAGGLHRAHACILSPKKDANEFETWTVASKYNMKTIGQKNLHRHVIQLGQSGGFPRKLLKLDRVIADYTS